MPCGVLAPPEDPRIPKITITTRGETFSYLDTEHVLDTFGYDLRCQRGESQQWRPVGASGAGEAGKLIVVPKSLSGPVGLDPYHGTPGEEEFTPEVAAQEGCSCQDCDGAAKCIREFAAHQRGGFSAFGLNCRSFQKTMMEHCCLRIPQELPPMTTTAVVPIF